MNSSEHENDEVDNVPAQILPAQPESPESQASPVLPAAPNTDQASAPAVNPLFSRQLDQTPCGQSTDQSDELDDDSKMPSAFSYLKDIRYLVALLTLSIVVMTATVLLLRPDQDPANPATANQPGGEQVQVQVQAPREIEAPPDPTASLARIEQDSDFSFELPVGRANLSGTDIKLGTGGIAGWGVGDEAAWVLVVKDRRSGYFNCKITYQAEQESAFDIQLGNRKPRSLTVYPHDKDFEEEFIVRLGKASKQTNEQTLKIKAIEAGAHQVEIKRVRLQPNR